MGDYALTKIIEKKRDGQSLSSEEIGYFVDAVTKTIKYKSIKEVPDGRYPDRCQIGAMLAFMYMKGLNDFETNQLMLKMKNSGRVFQWLDEEKSRVVDKHSTGGVGDKTSLILAPALAACGRLVPMISGRSLGHTGGTLDKLEAIHNFSCNLSPDDIYHAVGSVGCCIAGQTDDCVPADKVMYHCRDITGTVEYFPLIIASIASKKLSENPAAIVYDVKFGKGSIFHTKDEAIEAAKGLVKVSQPVKAVALLTSMEAPLGKAVGDALEVLESVDCLKGGGPSDVMELTKALGKELIKLTPGENEDSFNNSFKDGRALQKFHDLLLQQGVDEETAHNLCYGDAVTALKQPATHSTSFFYTGESGFISSIDPLVIGKAWKDEYSFSGRHPGVGFTIVKTIGDKIKAGDEWITFHHEREDIIDDIRVMLARAIEVSPQKMDRRLIDKRIFYKNESLVVEDYDDSEKTA